MAKKFILIMILLICSTIPLMASDLISLGFVPANITYVNIGNDTLTIYSMGMQIRFSNETRMGFFSTLTVLFPFAGDISDASFDNYKSNSSIADMLLGINYNFELKERLFFAWGGGFAFRNLSLSNSDLSQSYNLFLMGLGLSCEWIFKATTNIYAGVSIDGAFHFANFNTRPDSRLNETPSAWSTNTGFGGYISIVL